MRKILGFFSRPATQPTSLTAQETSILRAFAGGANDLAPQSLAIYKRARALNIPINPELAFVREMDAPVPDLVLRRLLRARLQA